MDKHSISIRGHRTSFSLERPFMDELRRMAAERGMALSVLVEAIDAERRPEDNLSSALRLAVLEDLRNGQGPASLPLSAGRVP